MAPSTFSGAMAADAPPFVPRNYAPATPAAFSAYVPAHSAKPVTADVTDMTHMTDMTDTATTAGAAVPAVPPGMFPPGLAYVDDVGFEIGVGGFHLSTDPAVSDEGAEMEYQSLGEHGNGDTNNIATGGADGAYYMYYQNYQGPGGYEVEEAYEASRSGDTSGDTTCQDAMADAQHAEAAKMWAESLPSETLAPSLVAPLLSALAQQATPSLQALAGLSPSEVEDVCLRLLGCPTGEEILRSAAAAAIVDSDDSEEQAIARVRVIGCGDEVERGGWRESDGEDRPGICEREKERASDNKETRIYVGEKDGESEMLE